MSHNSKRRLKLYSTLAQTAIRDGLALPYRLWTVARALDTEGQGWVTVGELCENWHQTERTIRTVLRRGVGVFWHVIGGRGVHRSRQRVFLHGLEVVCVALGTTPGNAVFVDFGNAASIKTFKALCLGAFFVDEKTISRIVLSECYGTTRQTLRSWEKTAGIKRQKNVAQATPKAPDEWLRLPGLDRGGVWDKDGTRYWQMPSTYYCDLPTAARPTRTAAAVRYTLSTEVGVPTDRLYWTNGLAAYKAANKGKCGSEYYVLTEDFLGTGRDPTRLWDHYATV